MSAQAHIHNHRHPNGVTHLHGHSHPRGRTEVARIDIRRMMASHRAQIHNHTKQHA